MSHGRIFPSASERRALGLECLGLSGKQSKQLHWGKGICLFFLERSFLPGGCVSRPQLGVVR